MIFISFLLGKRYPYLHPRPGIRRRCTGRDIRQYLAAVVIEFNIHTVAEEVIHCWRDRDLPAATGSKIRFLVQPAVGRYIIADTVINTEVDLVLQLLTTRQGTSEA